MDYLPQALFIYDEQAEDLIEVIKHNNYGVQILAVPGEQFLAEPLEYIKYSSHLVVSGAMEMLDSILEYVCDRGANGQICSLGFLPLAEQKNLRQAYQLSPQLEDNIEIALRDDVHSVNLQSCNNKIYQFKAVIGEIPLLESWHSDATPAALIKNIMLGLKHFFHLSKTKINIVTHRGKEITSVANGVFTVNQNRGSHLTRLIQQKSSMRSEMISMIIISPFSAIEYFMFLFSLLVHNMSNTDNSNKLPHAAANIQSSEIIISCESSNGKCPEVKLDGLKSAEFPLHFKVLNKVIKINAPETFWELNPPQTAEKEVIRVDNLPDEKELHKYIGKKLPFFSVASEERFKDLFLQLREDASINSLYIALIVLSTFLASLGLYANSSAVVIGAMLLAPLMAPIISCSMGLLRGEDRLFYQSLKKLSLGIVLALLAAFLVSLFMPQTGLSDEIRARIYPNLIDLAIAIFSGIAAAYTKAHKELLNNLAGVAIAVALIPPLASAGIGIGRQEYFVFEGGLLLFVTNLVAILVAATITFQFLGFSSTVKRKKSLSVIVLVLILLSYPLYRTYNDSLQRYYLSKALVTEQLTIHNKTVLIEDAVIDYQNTQRIINMTIVLKQALNHQELQLLQQRIRQKFSQSFTDKTQLRVSIKYIL